MAASRRMTVSGSTLRPGARQSISESWESRWRAWVDSMTVLYLPPNASVLADQKEVLTGWPSSPGPPPPCEKAVPPSTLWASSSQEAAFSAKVGMRPLCPCRRPPSPFWASICGRSAPARPPPSRCLWSPSRPKAYADHAAHEWPPHVEDHQRSGARCRGSRASPAGLAPRVRHRVPAPHPRQPARRAGARATPRRADDDGVHEDHAPEPAAALASVRGRRGGKIGFASPPPGIQILGRKSPRNHRGGPNGIRTVVGHY